MHPMLNIAIRAVRKGGNVIIQNYDTQKFIKEDITRKKNFIENVSYKTYKSISEIIYKAYPNHTILNNIDPLRNEKNISWIVHELDGKNNFIKNFPHFCVSITVLIKNNPEISVIYDPLRNDLFTSVKGQGSQLNGYRIRCSDVSSLNCATIAFNLTSKYYNNQFLSYLKLYKKLLQSGIDLRCTGSSMLDIAYVSSGRIDCLFNFNLKPINFLIGKLQAQESGCLINDLTENNKFSHHNYTNLIGSSKCIRLITEKIRENYF
ncbi:inositol monophosphatase [Buchnera aphidicola (Melanaphis sacchari)]|uniref:Inositol-1-monophosphatase n=1 Tax=Buchnera aphidicola (Melanaphis sacchari) TaxID=2173854 RepID=A0A2U8DGX5_9GAMM|nr:inositol monophosphatase family protein [Buchnera aphidicola]AWH90504.1 inositol monophosphatase [Buchnera aphidicola (Melanaphis sacchari)]